MSVNIEIIKLIDTIQGAFKDVHLDDGISLRQARVLDDHGNKQKQNEARKEDELENWNHVSFRDIEKYPGIFPFLDAKGVMFYLPVYMLFIIKNNKDSKSANAEEDIIYALTPDDGDNRWFNSHFCLVNDNHKLAIFTFLEWALENDVDKYYGDEIQKALEYWKNA